MNQEFDQYLAYPDRIVRDLFRNREDAIAFFQAYLPDELVGVLELENLSYLPDSYIDPRFKEHRSDILFEIPTRGGNLTQIALLFEHKKKPSRSDYTQLLRYLGVIYKKQKIPIPVIPFLFYHTEGRPIPANFAGLFDLSEQEWSVIGKYLPDFSPEIFFLSKNDTEKVRFSLHLYAFLSAIQYADLNRLAERWEELLEVTSRVFSGQKGLEELMKLVVYVINKTSVPVDTIKSPVLKISRTMEDFMVTTAEKLRQEGKAEGKAEGKTEGKLEAARKLLELGVALDIVLKATGLSREELTKAGIVK